jgi:hypothetical protein
MLPELEHMGCSISQDKINKSSKFQDFIGTAASKDLKVANLHRTDLRHSGNAGFQLWGTIREYADHKSFSLEFRKFRKKRNPKYAETG